MNVRPDSLFIYPAPTLSEPSLEVEDSVLWNGHLGKIGSRAYKSTIGQINNIDAIIKQSGTTWTLELFVFQTDEYDSESGDKTVIWNGTKTGTAYGTYTISGSHILAENTFIAYQSTNLPYGTSYTEVQLTISGFVDSAANGVFNLSGPIGYLQDPTKTWAITRYFGGYILTCSLYKIQYSEREVFVQWRSNSSVLGFGFTLIEHPNATRWSTVKRQFAGSLFVVS